MTESTKNLQNNLSDLNQKFNELSSKLENLQQFKSEIMEPNHHQNSDCLTSPLNLDDNNYSKFGDNDIDHVDMYKENFLDLETCNAISGFLALCEFTPENGHSVITYGETYRYTGSKTEPIEFPQIIKHVVDELNTKFDLEGDNQINSCLVNKFSGPESFLSEHSDNEWSINPMSSIYTVTIGDSRQISFRKMESDKAEDLNTSNGSLYNMTRKSQNFFTHQIKKDETFTGTRYTLTFRSVSWRFRNSTCVIGDSNTGQLKFGSESHITFGKSTPGKKVSAFHIEEIDPYSAVGYRNIVLLCGVNDLKSDLVQSQRDITKLYHRYRSKVEMLKRLNPGAKIHICQVLPTKSMEVNQKVLFFNGLLRRDLLQYVFGITLINGIGSFAGPDGALSRKYCRPQLWDFLHINDTGIRLLAKLIKSSLFQGKRPKGDREENNKTYLEAGSRSPPLS